MCPDVTTHCVKDTREESDILVIAHTSVPLHPFLCDFFATGATFADSPAFSFLILSFFDLHTYYVYHLDVLFWDLPSYCTSQHFFHRDIIISFS